MERKRKASGGWFLMAVCALTFSCDKSVHFDGVVLSRHLLPVSGAKVSISVGHGEHSSGGDGIKTVTDADGKFKYTGKICNNCGASAISAVSDSGFVESKDIVSKGQSNIRLVIK